MIQINGRGQSLDQRGQQRYRLLHPTKLRVVARRTVESKLQRQLTAERDHVVRLQQAIKYTVNSDLLFESASWQMSDDGKEIIAKMAKMLAPGQTEKLVVNGYTDDAAIGPTLRKQGITSNQTLSQKRAEAVMQYMISQGVKPNLITARGYGAADLC